MNKEIKLQWICHTPNLLKEILGNKECDILTKPLQIFGGILYQVAERAQELNDPELNALMCRLTLYSQADPESPDYDPELLETLRPGKLITASRYGGFGESNATNKKCQT